MFMTQRALNVDGRTALTLITEWTTTRPITAGWVVGVYNEMK